MINKKSRIFITGHKGLVGSSIFELLKKKGYKKIFVADRRELDLIEKNKVYNFIKKKKIDIIINCAAKVGGIMANSTNQVEFFWQNIQMQNNLLIAAQKIGIKRFVFLGSSCIYPKNSQTPIKEDQLLSGKLEKTNEAYALAKISGVKFSEFLFNEKKIDIVCLMPTNIYGIKDNFDKFSSHVIPGMISKFIDAKKKKKSIIELLGSGKPMREFLFNDDLATGIYYILKSSQKKILKATNNNFPIFNIGSGENISIKNLSLLIKKIVKFKGNIHFDRNYPDGTYKKNLNSNRIKKLGWKPKVNLKKGLKKVISTRLS